MLTIEYLLNGGPFQIHNNTGIYRYRKLRCGIEIILCADCDGVYKPLYVVDFMCKRFLVIQFISSELSVSQKLWFHKLKTCQNERPVLLRHLINPSKS